MKNDIKTKSFTVIRKYAPKEDDFWDDNPPCSEENDDDLNVNEDLIQYAGNKLDTMETTDIENNIPTMFDLTEIDISSLIVNFELNIYKIYDDVLEEDNTCDTCEET